LNTSNIYWESGSTANIDSGEISTHNWVFDNGTSAQLGTGNTAFVYYSIGSYDDNASFGNLIILPDNKKSPDGKTNYPIRVSGNCLMKSGISSKSYVPLYIEGSWEIENGASFKINPDAGTSYCNDLILNGSLQVFNNSVVEVHGALDFGVAGKLKLSGGSLVYDAPASKSPVNIYGTFVLNDGLFECTNNNLVFYNNSDTISGGTIRAGGSFIAATSGVFQPTGGVVEMIGSASGQHIQVANGNYLHDLVVNRTAEIQIYANTLLDIHNDFIVNSAVTTNHNDVIVMGNVAINNGGYLEIGPGSSVKAYDGSSITVNNGGTFAALGTVGNEAIITAYSGGYAFNINSGGTISADNAVFEYMNGSGINVHPGAVVDTTASFNHCLFRNGASSSSSTLLTIDNDQTFTCTNTSFENTSDNTQYNVTKNVDAGNVTFEEYSATSRTLINMNNNKAYIVSRSYNGI